MLLFFKGFAFNEVSHQKNPPSGLRIRLELQAIFHPGITTGWPTAAHCPARAGHLKLLEALKIF
jgi:hypothetical protein